MKKDGLLEDIKSRIDIVDFISDYVQLKKSGQNWKGLCPFHQEKTPSFTVSQSKQIFHCFGCGAGGDVITFLLKHDSLSFHEALTILAQKVGIAIDAFKKDSKSIEKDELVRQGLQEAGRFFASNLKGSKNAEAYIKGRGVSLETIELFQIGFAPSGWSNLLNHMRKKGYSDTVIKDAGLAVSGNKGLYDMFRERIMFPIRSMNGHVIAFGGRAMDSSMPKYINSPETPVFKKSETLYGLHTGKNAIREKGYVLIVEGYMDVIICYQYGFRNVVAPLGTSLTPGHLQKLRKLTSEAVVVFDGDAAGISAAKRSLPLLCKNNFKARLLSLPEGEDPDSYLRKNGGEAFSALLGKTQSVIEFLFSASRGGRVETVREALTLIAQNADSLAADEMLIELSGKTRISETTVREEFKRMKNRTDAGERKAALPRVSRGDREEYLLLSAVIHFPDKLNYVLSRLDRKDIRDSAVLSLFEKIAAAQDRNNPGDILDGAGEEERVLFTRLSVEPGFDLEHADRNIEDCLRTIEKKKFDKKFRQAELSGDIQLFNALLLEKKKLLEGNKI
ncbi:MAG: DNA primase [Nitrospirota bacterium]|nr:DNA primase [Nitrospirota bacterium]